MPQTLRTRGRSIVDSAGREVRLRGTCAGGWMNLEDFINGYPGVEHGLRAVMRDVLGPQRAAFFFDRLADHFLAEDDVRYLASLGATALRLPVNYRRLERDDAPFTYREDGFRRLEQAVSWCAAHGIYAIIDLHAVQGWQNTDWHSDNGSRHALLWEHPHFQDRFVALWREIAQRFVGNPAVAGYNAMNEPLTGAPRGRLDAEAPPPDWAVLNRLYRRVVTEIRAVDPDHIVFLEGDQFSSRFDGLDAPFADNLVYSSHNYTGAGFGPGPYPGGEFWGRRWDRDVQREVLFTSEGARFAERHDVPLWVGEFGSVYSGPAAEEADRLRAVADQIDVVEEFGAHWTTWCYKDVGVMGLLEVDPESPYRRLTRPVTDAKTALHTDFWATWLPETRASTLATELAATIEAAIPGARPQHPATAHFLRGAALGNFAGPLLQPAYAGLFAGLSEEDLDAVLRSFAIDRCRPRAGLVDVLRAAFTRPPGRDR